MTALVGPLRDGVVHIGPRANRVALPYDPPANTLDPRYAACTTHHLACDCREAEWAETQAENRWLVDTLAAACRELLNGHPLGCACTGCDIARRVHVYPDWIAEGLA